MEWIPWPNDARQTSLYAPITNKIPTLVQEFCRYLSARGDNANVAAVIAITHRNYQDLIGLGLHRYSETRLHWMNVGGEMEGLTFKMSR